MISVIIPHKNRANLLNLHLKRYPLQTLRQELFEVIVVDDGSDKPPEVPNGIRLIPSSSKGPASTRNIGAKEAKNEIILFVGDDCIPDRNLLLRHVHHYLAGAESVQGYTPFHPQVMITDFMMFLNASGLQANWGAITNSDGSWKSRINGFLLTTNWSIKRELFLSHGGFAERFPDAAWEDVELGLRLSKSNLVTIFDPTATNFHYHGYNLKGYMKRQFVEGKSRLHFCVEHTEVAPSLLHPEGIREARKIELDELVHTSNTLTPADLRVLPEEIRRIKYELWHKILNVSSMKGVIYSLENYPFKGIQAIEHLHKKEDVTYTCAMAYGVENDNYGWATHCREWLINSSPGNWAVWALAGELSKYFGQHSEALEYFYKSIELSPNSWAHERINEYTISD